MATCWPWKRQEHAFALSPDNLPLHRLLADSLLGLGRAEEAEQTIAPRRDHRADGWRGHGARDAVTAMTMVCGVPPPPVIEVGTWK